MIVLSTKLVVLVSFEQRDTNENTVRYVFFVRFSGPIHVTKCFQMPYNAHRSYIEDLCEVNLDY